MRESLSADPLMRNPISVTFHAGLWPTANLSEGRRVGGAWLQLCWLAQIDLHSGHKKTCSNGQQSDLGAEGTEMRLNISQRKLWRCRRAEADGGPIRNDRLASSASCGERNPLACPLGRSSINVKQDHGTS